MTRTFEQIRSDLEGTATLRNLVAVLDAKLDLWARYGAYEYEAAQDGFEAEAETFGRLAAAEREQIQALLGALCGGQVRRRFRRGLGPERPEEQP